MSDVEMIVDNIRVSPMNYQHLVLLKEKQADHRYLPIWIGPAEAEAIAIKLQNVDTARPLTHDFVRAIIELTGFKVKAAKICDLRNDTYYAEIVIFSKSKTCTVDCRPSDAIALAIRTKSPIFATSEILKKAGIFLDEESGMPIKQPELMSDKQPELVPYQVAYKLEKFSESTLGIFTSSQEEAKRLNHYCIGTMHLLLALVRSGPNPATIVLSNLGVKLSEIPDALESAARREILLHPGESGPTVGAQAVIQFSVEEAKRLRSAKILPEHLLVGIARHKDGAAAVVLSSIGVSLDKIYIELGRLNNQQ